MRKNGFPVKFCVLFLPLFFSGCEPVAMKPHVEFEYIGSEQKREFHPLECRSGVWITTPYPGSNGSPAAIGVMEDKSAHQNETRNDSVTIGIRTAGTRVIALQPPYLQLSDISGNNIKKIRSTNYQAESQKPPNRKRYFEFEVDGIPPDGAKLTLPAFVFNNGQETDTWKPSGYLLLKPMDATVKLCG